MQIQILKIMLQDVSLLASLHSASACTLYIVRLHIKHKHKHNYNYKYKYWKQCFRTSACPTLSSYSASYSSLSPSARPNCSMMFRFQFHLSKDKFKAFSFYDPITFTLLNVEEPDWYLPTCGLTKYIKSII